MIISYGEVFVAFIVLSVIFLCCFVVLETCKETCSFICLYVRK